MRVLLKIIMFATILSGTSCGSRKTAKSKTESKAETKIEASAETSLKTETEVKKDVVKETVSKTDKKIQKKKTKAKPVDPNKPMKKTKTVEGNTETTIWDNAEVIETDVADNSQSESSEKLTDNFKENSNSEFDQNLKYNKESERSSYEENKETDAERGFNFWWLMLLTIPAGIYIYLRRR